MPHDDHHQMHVCAIRGCGHKEPLDIHTYVEGAVVVEGRVEWRCPRHRRVASEGHQWIDLGVAPHYGD